MDSGFPPECPVRGGWTLAASRLWFSQSIRLESTPARMASGTGNHTGVFIFGIFHLITPQMQRRQLNRLLSEGIFRELQFFDVCRRAVTKPESSPGPLGCAVPLGHETELIWGGLLSPLH